MTTTCACIYTQERPLYPVEFSFPVNVVVRLHFSLSNGVSSLEMSTHTLTHNLDHSSFHLQDSSSLLTLKMLSLTTIIAVLAYSVPFLEAYKWNLASRSIESREACHGSTRLEHLSGVCMFHFECLHQLGLPIGSCFHNQLLVGSCCMLRSHRPSSLLHKHSKHITTAEGNKLTNQMEMSKATPSSPSPSLTTLISLSSTKMKPPPSTGKVIDSTNTLNSLWTTLPMASLTLPPTPRSPSLTLNELDPYPSTLPVSPPPSTQSENVYVVSNSIEDVFSNHLPFNTFPTSSRPVSETVGMNITTITTSSSKMTTTPRTPTMSQRPTSSTTPMAKPKPTCGTRPLKPTGRVVGGRNAQFGEWPWHVLIKETTWLGFFTKPKCGGVLISRKWVLTAAHCQPGMMGQMLVMLGQHDMNGDTQRIKPIIKTVKRMIVHRDYNPETFDNDIALLELDNAFEARPHIMPICLPANDENYVGKNAYVSGFGKLSYGGMAPNILQTVQLPIIDNLNCQKMFMNAGHFKYIRDQFLCAGSPGKDSCEGDSGGPLMIENNGMWTLIGTVSHGIKCAEPNMPGVYMKIYSYLAWIRGIIDKSY